MAEALHTPHSVLAKFYGTMGHVLLQNNRFRLVSEGLWKD